MNAAEVDPIAVTVIGGYLGAGKTTLVNEILRNADERVAVIVNDFGDVNIDADLITASDDQTLSLANGCICCSLVDGFAAALATINSLEPRPDRLVIEASGVADPAQVAAYGHAPGLVADATIVLADAETIRRTSRDRYVGDTVARQLAAADVVVLNKTDLVDADAVTETRAWLEERWPVATVVESEFGDVSPIVLFGGPIAERETRHAHDDAVFSTWTIVRERPLERGAVAEMMDEVPAGIVRAKGILWLADDADRASTLQLVGRRWSITPGRAWSGTPSSTLVFIGTDPSVGDRLQRLLPTD